MEEETNNHEVTPKKKKFNLRRAIKLIILFSILAAMIYGIILGVNKLFNRSNTTTKTIKTNNYTSKELALYYVPKDKPKEAKKQDSFGIKDSIEVQYKYQAASENAFVSFSVVDKDNKSIYSTNKIKLAPKETSLRFPLNIPNAKAGKYKLETRITPDDKKVNTLDFELK